MKDRIGNPGKTVAVAMVGLALLTGCSRASLLGGPGPEVVHHEYSCVGKQLSERSWKTGPGHAAETHHESDGGETH